MASNNVSAAIAANIIASDDVEDNGSMGSTIDLCDMAFEREEIGSNAAAIRALGESIRNTLWEIHELRERNRDRRHKELIEVLSSFANNRKEHHLQTEGYNGCKGIQTGECVVKDGANILSTADRDISNTTVKDAMPVNITNEEKPTTLQQEITSDISKENPTATSKAIAKIFNSNKASAKNLNTSWRRQSMESLKAQRRGGVSEPILSRARMLDMQRKKMEDRERKKRQFIVKKT